jgi:hypothetical protein
MPMPDQHIQERLSAAYVTAVVARAGARFEESRPPEYGNDGYIQVVTQLANGKYMPTGYSFWVQIKATTTCQLENEHVVYDMEVDAYNKLAEWQGTSFCLLVLLRLPKDKDYWLALDEEQLLMQNCCYWAHIDGPRSHHARSQRIRIPRNQLFTPQAIHDMLEKVKLGLTP